MTTPTTTQRTALLYAIENLPDAPAEIIEKWNAMLDLLYTRMERL